MEGLGIQLWWSLWGMGHSHQHCLLVEAIQMCQAPPTAPDIHESAQRSMVAHCHERNLHICMPILVAKIDMDITTCSVSVWVQ